MYLPAIFLSAEIPPGRVFGLDMQTVTLIGSFLVHFIVLAVILTFILYKPVQKFIAKRNERIEGQLAHAAEVNAKALELKSLYEQKAADIEAERVAVLAEAHKSAADASRQILDKAKAEAAVVRADTSKSIAAERERAKSEMKAAIISVSAAMSAKFVSESMDNQTAEKLFNETVAEVGALT